MALCETKLNLVKDYALNICTRILINISRSNTHLSQNTGQRKKAPFYEVKVSFQLSINRCKLQLSTWLKSFNDTALAYKLNTMNRWLSWTRKASKYKRTLFAQTGYSPCPFWLLVMEFLSSVIIYSTLIAIRFGS